jgi:hypothetical protein
VKLPRRIAGLLVAVSLASTMSPIQAQNRRPPGVASLGEMECQDIQGGYRAIDRDLAIGFEIFRAVAWLAKTGWEPGILWRSISGNRSVRVACRLAAARSAPRFRTLTLAIGIPDEHRFGDGAISRLSVYKDGNFYEYKDISEGEKLLWVIDVTNTRSLGLEGECVKTARYQEECPAIYFFEDILE